MKKALGIILSFFAFTSFCSLDAQWAVTLGGSGEDGIPYISPTKEGGFIIGCITNSCGFGDYDILLFKIDVSGKIQWQKCYGGLAADTLRAVQQTYDGGYIAFGGTKSLGSGKTLILKLNELGEIEWQRNIFSSLSFGFIKLKQTYDGGYLISGNGRPNSESTQSYGCAIKLMPDGQIEWQHYYIGQLGGYYGGYIRDFQTTSEGGFVFLGDHAPGAWVIKAGKLGEIEWQRSYYLNGEGNIQGRSIKQTKDGGYVFCGDAWSNEESGFWSGGIFAIKLTAWGDIEWQRRFGNPDKDEWLPFVEQTIDENIIIGALEDTDDHKMLAFMLAQDGEVIWQRLYGDNDINDVHSIAINNQNRLIIAGDTITVRGDCDILLLNPAADGNIPGCSLVKDSNVADMVSNYVHIDTAATIQPANFSIEEVNISTMEVTLPSAYVCGGAISVEIDIKPGSYPNSINLGSAGNVPVAIFSTLEFNATTVNPQTIILAGASVSLKGKGNLMYSLDDINSDGLMDIVVHVDTTALQLSPGDTEAILNGYTYDGQMITGTDTVRIVPE